MAELLRNLTEYNVWANKKFIDCLSGIEATILKTPVKSSFPTILLTCKHIWFGESGWLSRMRDLGWQTDAIDNFEGSHTELFDAWQITSKEYIDFVENEDLEITTKFVHDEIEYSIKRSDIVMTIINHGNYHRGQIVTMLRQLDINQIPKTDYIEWVREQERGKLGAVLENEI